MQVGASKWTARREVFALGVFAFAIRAVQNFWVHPPLLDEHSDMGGYIHRADALLRGEWGPDPNATFFPYGTHALVFALKFVFRGGATFGVSLVFALMGTFAVLFSYWTALRLWPARPWVARIVALWLATEIAWIELGSYVLSETPTALAIAASTFLSLRLVDEGKTRDAWWLGATLAVGATFRPQVLLSLVFLLVFLVFRRGHLGGAKLKLASLGAVVVPIALVLGGSSVRTHYDTGRWGTVSTNGPFNFVFGRCHCIGLTASQTRGSRFEPPSLKSLAGHEAKHNIRPIIDLDPAMGTELSFDGQVWDAEPAYALARRCVEKTGLAVQAKYGVTHLMLLWAYNLPWPTRGPEVVVATTVTSVVFLPGLIVALALAWKRERARELCLVAQLFGLFFTAILFFGEIRLRTPYDGVIAVLAFGAYADAIAIFRRRRTGNANVSSPESKAASAEVGGGSARLD